MATQTLATWAANLKPEDLPPTVQSAAKRSLYNYIGCAIGGARHPTTIKARSALAPFFGAPTSTLLGHGHGHGDGDGTRTDAQHASLLNGIASHVHDYDDTHLSTIIHPTGPVASAVLALAQHLSSLSPSVPISGPTLLCALAAGMESSCKLGLSVWPEHYDVGWHITSTTGSVGAAVAAGKLLNLSPEKLTHAVGIAATQVVGLREMFGSDTKSFHPGRAAQNGLMAALLAERGYTSSEAGLEAKRGWRRVVFSAAGEEGREGRLEGLIGELGKGTWEIERNAFKPFPCGIVCHPAIDGCVRVKGEMGERGLRVEDVERVELRVHRLVIELTSKRTPRDGLEAKFSVFHGCAVGLLYGKAGPAQYADEVVTSKEVVELRDRIDAEIDNDLGADAVHLTIYFKSGDKLEKHVDHAVGSLEVPMTDEQLTEKFIDQASLVIGQDAQKASELAWSIGDATDVASILRQL